jgi:hypothetical protein
MERGIKIKKGLALLHILELERRKSYFEGASPFKSPGKVD